MIKQMIVSLKNKIEYVRYRRSILKLMKEGLSIGRNVTIMPSAWIDHEYSYLISLGDNSSISKGVRLIAHDASTFKFLGITRVGRIEIKDNCFIGENAIILPGVTIGPNVLIAAGSLVNKDIPPNSCVAGVPARVYGKFDEFLAFHRKMSAQQSLIDYNGLQHQRNNSLRTKLQSFVRDRDAYVGGNIGRFLWTWNACESSI